MKDRTVFLFQGDSITDGQRGRNGDPNHCMGHGFAFSIASRLGLKYAEKLPSFLNRGTGGNTSAMLLERWEKDALELHPDVLTLLIGVNDLLCHCGDTSTAAERQAASPAAYRQNLRTMLSQSRQRNPALKILLGLPFFYRIDGYDRNIHWNADETEKAFTLDFRRFTQTNAARKEADILERQDIVREICQEFEAFPLDFPAAFSAAAKRLPVEYWTWDGVHPTVAGHQLLSSVWLDAWGAAMPEQ